MCFKALFMNSKHHDDLAHIRLMMERSSRFISLSGMSGILAGVLALIATYAAWYFIENTSSGDQLFVQLAATAVITLILALFFGVYLTVRKSRKDNVSIANTLTKRLILSLAIPLLAGAVFTIALCYHGYFGMVAPALLVFYGLSLINASKFTVTDIEYLGYCEVALGCMALFFMGNGLIFWAIGFGLLHIIYGTVMHKKYH